MFTEMANPPQWRDENPNRGTRDQDIRDACIVFINEFPHGTRLTTEDFDSWLERQGLLSTPVNVSKKSDAWKGHLQRRHEIKKKMTSFSTTTKIKTPFVLETIAGSNGQWEVRSPEHAISLREPGRKVESLVKTKLRQIEYLMQSADWENLPPYMKIFAESLREGIVTYASTINAHGSGLDRQFQNLQRNLKTLETQGLFKFSDGGVKAITDGLPESDEP